MNSEDYGAGMEQVPCVPGLKLTDKTGPVVKAGLPFCPEAHLREVKAGNWCRLVKLWCCPPVLQVVGVKPDPVSMGAPDYPGLLEAGRILPEDGRMNGKRYVECCITMRFPRGQGGC